MPTVGETLKQARLDRKLTLKAVSEATAIRGKFLEALESDDFDALPSPVQARGFLKIYADYLKLEADQLIAEMQGNPAVSEDVVVKEVPEDPRIEAFPADEAADIENSSSNLEEIEPDEFAVNLIELSQFDTDSDSEEISNATYLPLSLSESIYVEIGQQLRSRREMLSLALDEIERHTHIRKRYLMSLEAGAIDDLPSTVQARGVLSSYARFLDLDAESLLLRFAEGLQASRLERHPDHPKGKPEYDEESALPPALKKFFSTDLVFGGGMILAMLVFAIWGANRIIAQKELAQGYENSDQSISEVLLAATAVTEEATILPTPSQEILAAPAGVNETPTAFEFPTVVKASPVQVVTALMGNTWMRIRVDGKVEFQGRATVGSAMTFNGEEKVEVLAADGSLVQVIFNGDDLGLMADTDSIAEIIYTVQGALLPTPTSTATATRTPRVTPTFTPSITPTLVNNIEQ